MLSDSPPVTAPPEPRWTDMLLDFLIVGAATSFLALLAAPRPLNSNQVVLVGALATILAVLFEKDWSSIRHRLGQLRFAKIAVGLVGAGFGALIGLFFALPLLTAEPNSIPYVTMLLVIMLFTGATLGYSYFSEWRMALAGSSRNLGAASDSYLLDTTALIDGRIADLIERGIVAGNFYVPKFVLVELQQVADSATKKDRGRRGLGVMTRLRATGHLTIKDVDMVELVGADAKLKAIAKETGVTLITNDGHLKTLCESEDIPVLSLHEVAKALKPVLFLGDLFQLEISGRGRKPGQGIGYLPGGDMVIVENGDGALGKTVKVEVVRILPKDNGRTIIARLV